MPRLSSKLKSSRRAQGFKDCDYDHEIGLVDHDAPPTVVSAETTEIVRSSTQSALLDQPEVSPQDVQEAGPSSRASNGRPSVEPSRTESQGRGPSIDVQEPTPGHVKPGKLPTRRRKSAAERENTIEILYENERGGFLCGIALFSAKALGNFDPTPWTTRYHKTSPTNIHTAQVPDPSWEWGWSEWKVNHDEGMDEGGWEYSFMFSKKFSWHGPKWWNSFVRRRAWIRLRVRKLDDDIPADPHMLNTDYFTVRPASETPRSRSHSRSHSRSASAVGSMLGSRASVSQFSKVEGLEEDEGPVIIEDMETLMAVLRKARIDREKLEAVESYLEHGGPDLVRLKDEMAEIMRIFVFQASRKLLLERLTHRLEDLAEKLANRHEGEDDDAETAGRMRERREHLAAGLRGADEEVRRLAYWSDVKGMVEGGNSKMAVDEKGGWAGDWQGVDQSGPVAPKEGKIP